MLRRRTQPPAADAPRLRTPVTVTSQPSYRRWWWRRTAALSILVLGVLMAVSHMVEHLGRLHVLPGIVQDLVLGYPMAAVLVVTGLIAYPR